MAFLRRAQALLASGWGRFSSGIAMLGSLTWFLWPSEHWHVAPDALTAFIVAFLAWVAATFLGQSDQPRAPDAGAHPHDLQLLQQFNEVLPANQRRFLRDHNFGSPYNRKNVGGLINFVDGWQGADFEFHHNVVQKALENLYASAADLAELLGTYTYSTDNNVDVMTPLTDMDRTQGISQATLARIDEMNDAAAKLVGNLDKFIRTARANLQS